MKNIKFFSILFLTIAVISACGLINPKNKGKGFNLFPVQQDIDLGAQVAAEIDGNPTQYPLLDSIKYKEVYQYVYINMDILKKVFLVFFIKIIII